MNNTIYLNDKNEVVKKELATKYEQYVLDRYGNVIQRIYGTFVKRKRNDPNVEFFADRRR